MLWIVKKGVRIMSLSGLFEWFTAEIKYALFIAFFVLLLVTAFKRAWIALIGVVIGMAVIGIFIVDPEIIISISEWLTDKLNFGG